MNLTSSVNYCSCLRMMTVDNRRYGCGPICKCEFRCHVWLTIRPQRQLIPCLVIGKSRIGRYGDANVLPVELDKSWLSSDLTISGSRLGGGDLGGVRLVVTDTVSDDLLPETTNERAQDLVASGSADANSDGYLDQADLIQAFQAGKI